MTIIKASGDLKRILHTQKGKSSLGFIPTMGALHDGHLSLLRLAKANNGLVITSIFVNPTQFNDPSDFDNYPKTLENDIYMLEKAGCDYLFLPTKEDMYPEGLLLQNKYEIGEFEGKLEGIFRPGHFQGVCTIVDKLFELIAPDDAYFGQKDYQQCLVIKKMMQLRGYCFNLHICPTIRETDGLAMSSRNLRLSMTQRSMAKGIYQVLQEIKKEIHPGSLKQIRGVYSAKLTQLGFRTEYLEFADPYTLDVIENWDGVCSIVVLVAVFMGDIRLIDNIVISQYN